MNGILVWYPWRGDDCFWSEIQYMSCITGIKNWVDWSKVSVDKIRKTGEDNLKVEEKWDWFKLKNCVTVAFGYGQSETWKNNMFCLGDK